RQKWENLFKRRELVHVDAVKEFYAKMTVIHLKKKDVVKSKVRGVEMEFDHEQLATILGVPGINGICEYIKDVWEESKYTKPLEITRRFANDENIMAARRVRSRELKPFQRFVHFLVMKNVVPRFEEEAEKEDEGNQGNFDWETVIDEAAVERESGSGDKFYDAEDKEQDSSAENEEIPEIPETERLKFQAEFERKRANRFHDDLEKAKAENARLLALLHQAESKPHP
ncbi:hypothetical protein Dimus_008333, partial [Dionaea muscipula]